MVPFNGRCSTRIHFRTSIVPDLYKDLILDNLECDMNLYAADAVLMTHYKENKEDSFEKINRDLQRLNEWPAKWFMSFNPMKMKYMVIICTRQTLICN